MHNITDPHLYGVIGSMAISTKLLALKFSYIIVIIVGTLGVVRFYLRIDNTLQLKKYVLLPLLLVLTIRYYPVVIDYSGYITSKFIANLGGNTTYETLNARFSKIQKLMMPKSKAEEEEQQRQDNNSKDRTGLGKGKKPADSDEGWWDVDVGGKIQEAAVSVWDWIVYGIQSFIQTLQYTIIWVVRMVVEKIRNLVLGFLIITGPISLMLELVPAFRGTFVEWFKNYLNVIFWAATLAILDNLVYYYALGHAQQVASIAVEHTGQALNFMQWAGRFVNNLIITMMYLLTPTLTSLYIGNSSASGIMSRLVGFVTAGLFAAKMIKSKKE